MLAGALMTHLTIPHRIAVVTGALALLCVGATAKAQAVHLAAGVNAPVPPSDWLVFSIITGVILATTGAAYLFLRATARARLTEDRASEAMAKLRQELDVAQSIVMAEPQALVAFESSGVARLVNHMLDSKLGVPVKLRNLMRFSSE
jgi:hypothetical protein